MSNLGNKEDVQKSEAASERAGGLDFIKLDQTVNFVCVVSADYADGFFHFLSRGKGAKSILCKAGLEGRGFAPDECPLCAESLEHYNQSKELKKAGDEGGMELEKKKGNNLRAQYQMFLHAVKGDAIWMKDKKGNKVQKADFDGVEKVGIWSLTDHQKKLLLSLIDDPKYSQIEDGDDLVGVVLKIVRDTEGVKKVMEIIPVGKMDLNTLNVDLKELPTLDRFAELPDDYEARIEEIRSGLTKEVEEEDDEGEYKIPKKSAKGKK